MKFILFALCFILLCCGPLRVTMQNAEKAPLNTNMPKYIPIELPEDNIPTELPAATCQVVYFSQNDPRWAEKNYGPENSIGTYGCGPTVLAMLVSSLTEEQILPDEMAAWCYQNGFFSQNSGSCHSIIPEGAKAWGLNARSLKDHSYRAMLDELYTGRLLVLLMGEGHFTAGGHFLILRNVTLEGDLLIADPNSVENSLIPWSYDLIRSELKQAADTGGPIWSIGR